MGDRGSGARNRTDRCSLRTFEWRYHSKGKNIRNGNDTGDNVSVPGSGKGHFKGRQCVFIRFRGSTWKHVPGRASDTDLDLYTAGRDIYTAAWEGIVRKKTLQYRTECKCNQIFRREYRPDADHHLHCMWDYMRTGSVYLPWQIHEC